MAPNTQEKIASSETLYSPAYASDFAKATSDKKASSLRALGASAGGAAGKNPFTLIPLPSTFVMKPAIHPKYFDAAEIRCSCGNVIIVGSTKEHLKTELCSKCHPFYTGQQKLVDTAGRVDKFEAKRKKSAEMMEAAKQRIEDKKKKPESYKEREIPAEVIERAMGEAKPAGKWGGPIGDAPAEIVVKEEIAEAKEAKAKAKKAPAKKAAVKKAAVKKPAAKKKAE